MKKRFSLIVLLLLLIWRISEPQQESGFQTFAKKAVAQMQADQIPGMSIGFSRDDFEWTNAFGHSDLENDVPARADSSYRLASVTKPMTATAVLLLVQDGKINLDAEIQQYVPYFPKKKWPITIRQLLGHTGGISHYKDYDVEGRIKEHKETREAIAIFENFDLVAEPGTKYSYSTYGYNLLGAAIEGASGMSYGDFMRTRVWEPFGMTNTRMDSPSELIPNRVRGYCLVDGKIRNSEYVDMSSRFAGGGTRSTVGDLLKFARGLNQMKALSPQTTDTMWTSMTTRDGRLTDYGMGWEIEAVNGHFVVSHSGSQQETRTMLYNFPALHLVIAAADNQEDVGPSSYARRLYRLVTGEPWNLKAYPVKRSDAMLLNAMDSVFNEGMAYHERYGKPMTSDAKELADAFQYWNSLAAPSQESKPEALLKKWDEGHHPPAGMPFVKMGSWMAAQLQDKMGIERLSQYSQMGSILFFDDYRKLNVPKENTIARSAASKIAAWDADWKKTCTFYARSFWITPDADLDEIRSTLITSFGKAGVYPDLTDEFSSASRKFVLNDQWKPAELTARTAAGIYPNSDTALASVAIARLHEGDDAEIAGLLKRIDQMNPEGPASQSQIEDSAYDLLTYGKSKEAIRLVVAATQLHPDSAMLFADLAELYLAAEDKQRAKESCEKALRLDPNDEHAKEILKKLEEK